MRTRVVDAGVAVILRDALVTHVRLDVPSVVQFIVIILVCNDVLVVIVLRNGRRRGVRP